MNVYLADVVQFAITHGVALGIAAISIAGVIGICFKETR
jgi:hypothetical protein